ncbi:MAG: hypothetical protein JWP02_3468 [Acidimicrobiales bacterium]|nr:hypothetical protein [Acidimicrobiales bacterium]
MTHPTTRRPAGDGPKAPKNRPSTNDQTPSVKGVLAAQLPITRIRRLASPPPRAQIGTEHGAVYLAVYLGTVVLRLAGAGLLVWVGAIHLDLWSEGYRQIPTDGPLFLADAIAGFALAAGLLAWPRPLVGLLGTGFMATTLGGLVLSINVGLFGFQESIRASFVVESILLESVGAIPLLAWTVIMVEAQPERRSRRR